MFVPMAVAERTYSFRAASSLGERMRAVQQLLADSPTPDVTNKLVHEFILALRRRGDLQEVRDNQSAFIRMTIELLATATEKIESDGYYTRLYAEARTGAREDRDEQRDGAKRAVARRWQNL